LRGCILWVAWITSWSSSCSEGHAPASRPVIVSVLFHELRSEPCGSVLLFGLRSRVEATNDRISRRRLGVHGTEQRPCEPHRKVEHIAAPTNAAPRERRLTIPSRPTHGPAPKSYRRKVAAPQPAAASGWVTKTSGTLQPRTAMETSIM
jgi:hypothetical protein